MRTKLFIVSLLMPWGLLFNVLSPGVTGKWAGTLKTQDDIQYPLEYNLKVDGTKLTGTGLSPDGVYDITDGKIDGISFSFNLSVDGKQAKHTCKYIAIGDSISLDIYFDGNKWHSTLLRSK